MKEDGEEKERKRREKEEKWRVSELGEGWLLVLRGCTPLVLTLKSNLGLIKKSQSISRDVINLYRV